MVNVVVTDPIWEMVVMSVISQLVGVIVEFNAIVKIRKYKGLHEGHHFILMAMEVHGALGCDMDCFIRDSAYLFHNRRSKGHLSLFFCIQFCRQCVNITLQHVLTYNIERKIALAKDAYS